MVEIFNKGETALVIGPGAVALDQGAYLQYQAARTCRLLRRKGLRVLVLEDNPATMMDSGGGNGDLYIEPPTPEVVERIVERNEVDSLWYGPGGRRGWVLALRMESEGWRRGRNIFLPGGDRMPWLCGDRAHVRQILKNRGIANPCYRPVAEPGEGQEAAESIGFPLVVRPHYSGGGWGSGVAYNIEEYPLLIEEAARNSLTGKMLVEEALIGWRKYISLVFRDGKGNISLGGTVEQVEPLPKHDQDAVLVTPPPELGEGQARVLESAVREVAEALDLLGLSEVKLAFEPGWRGLYVIDVNPWPWRTLSLLETLMGADLLRIHVDLVTGSELPRPGVGPLHQAVSGVAVSIPRGGYELDGYEEGFQGLGCRSYGRMVFKGKDVEDAVTGAISVLREDRDGDWRARVTEVLESLRRRVAVHARRSGVFADGGEGREAPPLCVSRHVDSDVEGGILLLAGAEGDAGGQELDANCMQALQAWKKGGGKAVLLTPNPDMALLAAEEANAVFLGSMRAETAAEAALRSGVHTVVPYFGGPVAMRCARELAASHLEVWGWKKSDDRGGVKGLLEDLRSVELPVIECFTSMGGKQGVDVLQRTSYPVMATVGGRTGEDIHRLVYGLEDGKEFIREYQDREVLWRVMPEEAQEIQVEAIGGSSLDHLVLLWEQLGEVGICSTDGLAVYPPFYLTSEQSRKALMLAREIIEVLGWRGNMSMKMSVDKSDIRLWDLSRGASASLPFLCRASSIPLAALGIEALGEHREWMEPEGETCSAVRAPCIPYKAILRSDILPSPQRRSTGSVMGVAHHPGVALAKALWSEGVRPQPGGGAFLSVANREKRRAVLLARELEEAGYVIMATRGTARMLASSGMEVEPVNKLREGRPNILDYIRNGQVGLVVNIPRGKSPHSDGFYIRGASARHGIPCVTSMEVALALSRGLREADPRAWEVRPLDEYVQPRHEVIGG